MQARLVVLVVYHNVNVLDVAGPLEAFSQSVRMRPDLPPFYRLVVASPQGGAVLTSAGLPLHTSALAELDPGAIDTVLLPGGAIGTHVPDDAAIVAWVRQHHAHWRRLCSVCTGCFFCLLPPTCWAVSRSPRIGIIWRNCVPVSAPGCAR